jgi:hypothetical protein
MAAVLLLSLVPPLRAGMATTQLILIILFVLDAVVLGVRLSGQLRKRFPDERRNGAVTYGILRSFMVRPWRMPKPRVKPGTKL